MTDHEVITAVDRARRALKAAETRRERALQFFGSSDVEQASRHNELKRAEVAFDSEISADIRRYNERLSETRRSAGQWADLVPHPRGV